MEHKDFIKNLAKFRASQLFNEHFFENYTDAWFLDEKIDFENYVFVDGSNPSEDDVDYYMSCLSSLKHDYEDKIIGDMLTLNSYKDIIDKLRYVVISISMGNKNYSKFNIDKDVEEQIKNIGNIFVDKYNELALKIIDLKK